MTTKSGDPKASMKQLDGEPAESVAPLLGEEGGLYRVTLINKIPVNHDTRVFRFALPSAKQVLGVPVGQHVGLSFMDSRWTVPGKEDEVERGDGKEEVLRWYTPLSSEDDRGILELLIKVYGLTPDFPRGGRLTQHLERMREGDSIDVRGPRGKMRYLGRGRFLFKKDKNQKPGSEEKDQTMEVLRVNMIAGGSGIAPMLQLLRTKARDQDCTIEVALIFANHSEDDIMMRDELERLHQGGTLSKLWYTVDRPSKEWSYSVGHVTEEMMTTHLFPPSEETLNLMCGRKVMVRGLVQPLLEKIGHQPLQIFKY